MLKNESLSVDELMKKSVVFALVVTSMIGTSNLDQVRNQIQVSGTDRGSVIVEQVNE